MQHTLITVFDNRADAQSANDALRAAGFTRTDIRADQSAAAGVAPDASGAAPGQHGVVASIRHFFADLFGNDEADRTAPYNDALARGMFVVTVVTSSEGEIEDAAAIVERFGPVDIDEEGGGRFVSGGATLQGGGNVQGATGADATENDSYFYMHYQRIYSVDKDRTYDEYLPSYQYGADRAAEQGNRGRAWDDVEPSLKQDWEAHNSGSAWENFKAAVRHGWEKVKR